MALDYTTLITSQHRTAPKFVETVGLLTGALGEIFDVAKSLPAAFDVDVAVGVQLDAVGKWVGFSRELEVPLSGVYFSLDVAGLGFDEGYLQGPFDPTEGVVSLDDDTYRILLLAVIGANVWDGTNLQQHQIASTSLAGVGIELGVFDNQDMSYDVYLLSNTPSETFRALIKRDIIPPKPAGVRVRNYLEGSPPFFALDIDTPAFAGFDVGSFATPF